MHRTRLFTIRLSADERRMLAALAVRLQRTQSDTLRLLLREALLGMEGAPAAGDTPANQEAPHG